MAICNSEGHSGMPCGALFQCGWVTICAIPGGMYSLPVWLSLYHGTILVLVHVHGYMIIVRAVFDFHYHWLNPNIMANMESSPAVTKW